MTEQTIDPTTGEIVPVQQDPKALAPLFAKLANVMSKVGRLPKSGHNSHFNYDFVTDGDVAEAVRPILAAEGIAFFASMRGTRLDGKKTTAYFTFTFADGKTGATWSCDWEGEAIDSQDKGTAKAATSALKYFLLKNFVLSSGDPLDDSDADAPAEKKPPAKANGNDKEEIEQAKTAFFAGVIDKIPYYESNTEIGKVLKQAGFTTYKQADETKMLAALEKHANEAANKEAA